MEKLQIMEAQLVELQTQLAFQDDTITELNRVLALQQQDLAQLKTQWQLLQAQYAELHQRLSADGSASLLDEKPPHS